MKKTKTIEIPNPANHHTHLREGRMLEFTSFFSRLFSVVVAKANLTDPVVDAEGYDKYYNHDLLTYSMPQIIGGIMMTPNITAGTVTRAHQYGARFVANIPAGVSTNSNGVLLSALDKGIGPADIYDCMSQLGMPLLLHVQSEFNKNLNYAELKIFFDSIRHIRDIFPRLKISIEHPNFRELIDFIIDTPGVTGGVAPHYGIYTRSDALGKNDEVLRPEIFCQPPYGNKEDRLAVIRALANPHVKGERKFRWAPDDAPHPIENKKGANPASGVFSGPVGPCIVVAILEEIEREDALPSLMEYDEEFFGVPLDRPHTKTMVLAKQPWKTPKVAQCGENYAQQVYLLKGGEVLEWQIL